ncbi:MAG TPA: FAD:protein FMN transferase [Candidatus Polarisedimenticolaceae bacterium]
MPRTPHLLVALLLAAAAGCAPAARTWSEQRVLMGTVFRIQVHAPPSAQARRAVAAALDEVARVEALLSEWRETSEISALNRAAGRGPLRVGPELLEVLERAALASEATGGAFDVTFATCGGLWSFRDARVPSDDELATCLGHVGFRKIRVDRARSEVEILDPATRIGLGGIGKGYGVDRAAAVLERAGVGNYVVDGGGDLRIRGRNGDRPWTVGLADPRRKGELAGRVEMEAGSIVTSGDYESYFERDGVRYHHILDPATGRPARGSIAVTVVAPDATWADALATGLFVMGPERAIPAAEALPGVSVRIVSPDGAVHTSRGFPKVVAGNGTRI